MKVTAVYSKGWHMFKFYEDYIDLSTSEVEKELAGIIMVRKGIRVIEQPKSAQELIEEC